MRGGRPELASSFSMKVLTSTTPTAASLNSTSCYTSASASPPQPMSTHERRLGIPVYPIAYPFSATHLQYFLNQRLTRLHIWVRQHVHHKTIGKRLLTVCPRAVTRARTLPIERLNTITAGSTIWTLQWRIGRLKTYSLERQHALKELWVHDGC
ncbi:hypothetical protein CPB84DRAFT_1373937 [Gymnopilus junonius]|uniref:Uncharacterized protein n=1 Tax=Gymnopilus junonius TaxID=109634 RepID=A0A9P5NKV9_GYMJU|nr:hypothetical protein CPB84DRAFT_1373937 [Gymnopilus junonius]